MWPQPIVFHDVRSDNVRLSRDKSRASRYSGLKQALCFTDRPLGLDERLQITLTQEWGGQRRPLFRDFLNDLLLGLTSLNPLTIVRDPRDTRFFSLMRLPGFWGKRVSRDLALHNQSFCMYYNRQGEMMLELPDGRSEVFLSGLDVSRPLFASFGSTMAIQIGVVQPRDVLTADTASPLPRARPIVFHDVRSDKVRLSRDKSTAYRYLGVNEVLCFTDRPLVLNERLQVTFTIEWGERGTDLLLGLTLHNPLTIAGELQHTRFLSLMEHLGFWGKQVPNALTEYNQSFCMYYNRQGEMILELPNGVSRVFLSDLDVSRPLFAIFGNTLGIQIEVVQPRARAQTNTPEAFVVTPCDFFPNDGVVKTNGQYATKSSPFGCGIAVVERSIAAGESLFVIVGKFHDRLKSAVRFALTSEAAPNVASLDSIGQLIDSTEHTVTFCTEIVESSELAVTIDENGDVFESVDKDSWKFLGHVDENVRFHLVVDMSAMKDLEILGTTRDILRIMPDCPKMARVNTASHSDGDRVCIVCLEGDRSMLLEPCLHFVLCGDCSKALRKNNCPLCRTPIRRVKRIYMS